MIRNTRSSAGVCKATWMLLLTIGSLSSMTTSAFADDYSKVKLSGFAPGIQFQFGSIPIPPTATSVEFKSADANGKTEDCILNFKSASNAPRVLRPGPRTLKKVSEIKSDTSQFGVHVLLLLEDASISNLECWTNDIRHDGGSSSLDDGLTVGELRHVTHGTIDVVPLLPQPTALFSMDSNEKAQNDRFFKGALTSGESTSSTVVPSGSAHSAL